MIEGVKIVSGRVFPGAISKVSINRAPVLVDYLSIL